MAPKIDHIVVGLPYSELLNPPEWLTKNFTLTPGGQHADGKTENKLIIFQDGSYIELIAFVNDDPENRKGHWWGNHDYGYMDWALTSSSPDDVQEVNRRIESAEPGIKAKYAEPRAGGRKKPDGTEIKWKVTFPEHVRRGELPFWCHDVTPREKRVPTDFVATSHPCGAVGVGQVNVLAPSAKIEPFGKIYGAIVGKQGTEKGGQSNWEIEAPRADPTLLKPSIVLGSPTTKFEEEEVKGKDAALAEIALLTDTVGLGQSRDALIEKLGGKEVTISFLHGKLA